MAPFMIQKCRLAMLLITYLKFVMPLISCTFTAAAPFVDESHNPMCKQIAASTSSSSDVYYPGTNLSTTPHSTLTPTIMLIGDRLYVKGVIHRVHNCRRTRDCSWCWNYLFLSGHPNRRLTPPKLGIVGNIRTLFAASHITFLHYAPLEWRQFQVKGDGHATNPKFSSTTGV